MGIIEWLGESYTPGPVGTVDGPLRQRVARTRGALILRSLGALMFLGLVLAAVVESSGPPTLRTVATTAVLLTAYSLLGYFARPKPDMDNVGLAGGLVDHPFRYSDDLNRTLLFVEVLLFPGQLLAETALDLLRLVRGGRP